MAFNYALSQERAEQPSSFSYFFLRTQHWLEGKWMYYTHESRYLHTHLSCEVVIVQPGHFNWSAVLVPISKPINGYMISTDLCPTSLQRGGKAACLLSACYYWMISQVQAFTDQATAHESSSGSTLSFWPPTVSSPIQKRGCSHCRAFPTVFTSLSFVSICFCCLCISNVWLQAVEM